QFEALEELWRRERGDLCDLLLAKRDNVEHSRSVSAGRWIPPVGSEGELSIGGGRDEPPATGHGGQEGLDGRLTAKRRLRHHREHHVLGKQRRDRADIAIVPRVGEVLHELTNARVAERAQGCLLASLRRTRIQAGASPL